MGLRSPPFFCHYHAFIQSVIPDFTAQTSRPRRGFDVRKAMNLVERECTPDTKRET